MTHYNMIWILAPNNSMMISDSVQLYAITKYHNFLQILVNKSRAHDHGTFFHIKFGELGGSLGN